MFTLATILIAANMTVIVAAVVAWLAVIARAGDHASMPHRNAYHGVNGKNSPTRAIGIR